MFKSFGKKEVLKGASFSAEPGSLVGIVGENGSGKSTLLKIIVGEWRSDRGEVILNGSVGYCPQRPTLFEQLTVKEHFQYFSAAYSLDETRWQNRFKQLTELFGYTRYENERVSHLSGGTQQKLNLSLALFHQPRILILDEPYAGFDWDTYLKFWEHTHYLLTEGCAILVVTHLLSEKDRFDRIYELKNGVLI